MHDTPLNEGKFTSTRRRAGFAGPRAWSPWGEAAQRRRGAGGLDRQQVHFKQQRGVRRDHTTRTARAELKCVVIRGTGSRYFAAGGDLRDLADVRTEAQTRAMVEECRGALDAVSLQELAQ